MERIKQNGLSYETEKTPFFEVHISDSTGKKSVPLPHHILRLVTKVEILETFEQGAFNTITLSFVEGSREPGSPDASVGTSGLYRIPKEGSDQADVDIAGSLTNRTGIIADLRFSGSGGITFTTDKEKRAAAIDTSLQKNVNDDITTRAFPREDKRPTLLFQERNQVKVTWGYREDPNTVRSVRAYIMIVSVKYPELGHVETTITCQDTGSALDQISTVKGVKFGKRVNTGNGSVVKFEDDTTENTIRTICSDAGIACIVSKNLPFDGDEQNQKMWVAGESFQQFMWRLAKDHNCYYKVVPDPETGIDTLMFIKKTDFERRIILDRRLLTYKSPGSILRSAEIKVDFGGLQGNAQKGIERTGESPTENSKVSGEQQQLFENGGAKENIVDTHPSDGANKVKAVQGIDAKIAKGGTTGDVEVSASENRRNKEDASKIAQDDQSRVIQLDFSTIGYTKITPGTVDIGGIGVRYSGKYRIMTASHIIENGGYVTNCSAMSMALAAGGQLDPGALIEKEQQPEQGQEQLFKRADDTPDADDDTRKKWDEVNQTK